MDRIAEQLEREVVRAGICVSCGACVTLDTSGQSRMQTSARGPVPVYPAAADLAPLAWSACPGKGIDYPELYRRHYGALPDSWLVGPLHKVRTGHAADPGVRAKGASGGVTSAILIHLLLCFPGGELEGKRPKALCAGCREALKREVATYGASGPARRSRLLCFDCYRADLARTKALKDAGELDTASELKRLSWRVIA